MQSVTSTSIRYSKDDKERIPEEVLQDFRTTTNLNQLNVITVENVVRCLIERFNANHCYTFAGSTLISLNPCSKWSRRHCFEDLDMIKYKEACLQPVGSHSETSIPHVYAVGLRSMKNLRTTGKNQIIVVSGDSGAGKTTCTQQLIRYFTTGSSASEGCTNNITCRNLEKKIYYATVILEAFGNASTITSPNSSRFGRLVQLCYNQDNIITGASIKTCMLEKHRANKSAAGERNFHVFYYLLQALQSGHMKIEAMGGDCNQKYEEKLPIELLNGIKKSDGDDLKDFLHALNALDLSEDFMDVFRVVFAIMHLIDVGFIQQKDEGDDEDGDTSTEQQRNNFKEYTVTRWNRERVATSCSILGLNEDALVDAFISQTISASNKRHSIYRKACERESECEERAQSFVTTLYDSLFHHVLSKVNGRLQQEVIQNSSDSSNFGGGDGIRRNYSSSVLGEESKLTLSLLDLYGFENFECNHLEQLCINYANERLQQVEISILMNYLKEKANLKEIEAFDEASEVILLEREIGHRIDELQLNIFSTLNEERIVKECTTENNIYERIRSATETAKFISCGRSDKTDYSFTIRHYAMKVEYNFIGMPEKNEDFIPREFHELCKSSPNNFIVSSFEDKSTQRKNIDTPRNKNETGKTIIAKWRGSVEELISEFESNENQDKHFIRCIKPNINLTEGKIQAEVVKSQLQSCGIVDIVRISGIEKKITDIIAHTNLKSPTENLGNRSSNSRNLQFLIKKLNLVQHDGIVSRNPIHTLPIKVDTKNNTMGHSTTASSKFPPRLAPNGLQDAFVDYGILCPNQSTKTPPPNPN